LNIIRSFSVEAIIGLASRYKILFATSKNLKQMKYIFSAVIEIRKQTFVILYPFILQAWAGFHQYHLIVQTYIGWGLNKKGNARFCRSVFSVL